jgi:hypothetical protein
MKRTLLGLVLFAGIASAGGMGGGGGGGFAGGPFRRGSGFEDMVGLGTREGVIVNARRSVAVPPGEFKSSRYVSTQSSRIYVAPPEGGFSSVNLGRYPTIADGRPADFKLPYAWLTAPAGAANAKISGLDREGRTLLTPRP